MDPNSIFMRRWDIVMATCLVFVAFVTPFEVLRPTESSLNVASMHAGQDGDSVHICKEADSKLPLEEGDGDGDDGLVRYFDVVCHLTELETPPLHRHRGLSR